jgi:D-alanyl-lipoteichoic acid acyltransferase DltB (MBOAT superfamily)
MLFNSYIFLLAFLPLSVAVYALLRRAGRDRAALLALATLSLAFYGWWSLDYLLLLLVLIAVNYGLACGLIRYRGAAARLLLLVGVLGNLAVLGYFKYAGFVLDNLHPVLRTPPIADIVLPLGISFFTFQKIALLVDAYQGKLRRLDPLGFLLFVSFFPQLIAGPIVHHSEVMPQFARRRGARPDELALGLTILGIGLAKKVLLADTLALHASPVFAAASDGHGPGFATAWSAALAYTLQLYFDFSGYCDMAVGAALLFGIRLPLNFTSPYKATSVIEFWRRWHMTLSRFLKDYLYVPLGGNRKGPTRRHLNLFLTMLLGGLWHGAGWTFIVWGALHGVYLIANHGWRAARQRLGWAHPQGRAGRIATQLSTFLAIVAGWVIFRADDLTAAGMMLRAMVGLDGLAASAGGFDWQFAAFGLAPLLAVVWLAPNTQEITGYRPEATEGEAGSLQRPTAIWSARPIWAMALGCVFAAGLLSLSKVSEFLYFQF